MFVSRDDGGHLHKVPVPLHYAYMFVAAAVIGMFTVAGLAGSYSRMLIKTGRFNQLRQDHNALQKDYAHLEEQAHEKDMLTTPYVFSEQEATAMAIAGADIIVCHMGLTTGGTIGAQTALKLADCPARIEAWAEAALSVNSNIIVLAHGGPIADPADADFIMKSTRKGHGFYGASSMERLPVEQALTDQVRKFKAIGAR